MCRPHSTGKSSNDKPVRHLYDATRRARVRNLAADALEIVGTWDSDLTTNTPAVIEILRSEAAGPRERRLGGGAR